MCRIDFSSSYLFVLNMMKMFDLQVQGPRCERFVYIVIFINLIVQISVGCLSVLRESSSVTPPVVFLGELMMSVRFTEAL